MQRNDVVSTSYASLSYQYAAAAFSWVKQNTIGDFYEVARYRQDFIFSEIVARAKDTNIGIGYLGPAWLKWTPQVVVVMGSRENILQVADYDNQDPLARAPFHIIDNLMWGEKSIITLQGEAAKKEKKIVNSYLIGTQSISAAIEITEKRFDQIMTNWDVTISYQQYFSYLGANLFGECILGIPEFDMKYVPLIRKLSDLVALNDTSSPEYLRAKQDITNVSAELLTKFYSEIVHGERRNFLVAKMEIKETETPDEIKKKLLVNNVGVDFMAESNISAAATMAIMQIHQTPEMRDRLIQELIEKEESGEIDLKRLDHKTLVKLPYLDCVFKETLRFMSPAGVIPRQTKFATTLKITDKNNEEKQYTIPAYSRLFTPIRSMHHGSYWENPEQFNPDRFLSVKEDYKNHYLPFSTGARQCPAGSQFVPSVVKKLIIDSLFYELKFDHQVKEMKPFSPTDVQPRWDKDIFLTEKPKKIANDLRELKTEQRNVLKVH